MCRQWQRAGRARLGNRKNGNSTCPFMMVGPSAPSLPLPFCPSTDFVRGGSVTSAAHAALCSCLRGWRWAVQSAGALVLGLELARCSTEPRPNMAMSANNQQQKASQACDLSRYTPCLTPRVHAKVGINTSCFSSSTLSRP